jgi:spermidine/putrescine transport system permease protein
MPDAPGQPPVPAAPPAADAPVAWRGELVALSRLRRGGALLGSPALLWLTLFFVLPTLLLLAIAFTTRSSTGGIEWTFTLDNFKRLAGYGLFGWSPANGQILLRSIAIATASTGLCLLLAYPLAFFIACRPARTRVLWLIVLTVPFWTNLIVRTCAWLILLGPESPLTRLAAALGLAEPGAALYPSTFATLLGMISAYLPFMVMPLYGAVEKLDWKLIEAAQDLYGGRWRVFRHAILPQTYAALFVGVILAFIPAMSTFLISDILGGARFMLIGNLIQTQFSFGSGNPPYAAAMALVLIVFTLVIIAVFSRLGGKREDLA